MSLKLTDLLETPKSRWFCQKVVDGELLDCDEPDGADIALHIQYMNKREYTKFTQDLMLRSIGGRKVVHKKGIKAAVGADEMAMRKAICEKVLIDWRLTIRGAHALGLEIDYSKVKADQTIPFDPGNRATMAERSMLAVVVNEILNSHDRWFELDIDEEEIEGNLGAGQPGSTADSPAQSAPKAT